MKRSGLFIVFILFLVFTDCLYLFSIEADSRVVSVTVFPDRAMVTRRITFSVVKGSNRVELRELPRQLDPASVQVKGRGDMVLNDVKVSDKYLTGVYSERLNKLIAEKSGYEKSMAELRDRKDEAASEKKFVQNIASMLTRPSDGSSNAELDPDKWIKMVDFYRGKLRVLDDEIRETSGKIREISKEIDRINREINSIGSQRNKAVKEIEILVDASSAGRGEFDVSYIVPGPTWVPDYTVQVDDRKKEVSLIYKAFVYQSTGEDWGGVKLSLSTAKPSVGGDIPELSPWYLERYNPDYYTTGSYSEAAMPVKRMEKAAPPLRAVEEDAEPLPELKYAVADMETGLTSVVFNLQGMNSVESDNQAHAVTISIMSMPVEFSYAAVPKLSPFVYLQGKVKNNSGYPLLPGETHIFLGGNFVAKASLGTIAPGEEFRINLGIDEGFKVGRTLVNRFVSESGFFSKKTKITYTYSIELKNNKTEKKDIGITDQLPVSTEKDIVVTLIEPQSMEKDEYGFVKWHKSVASGETLKIPFSFSVEYPSNTEIDNLE